MLRATVVVSVAFVSAAAANAAPDGPLPPPPPCAFTLSATTVGDTVTATVQSVSCAPAAVPYLSVVCLQPSGEAATCSQGHGVDPARIVVPYQTGTSYTATGRGCARWVGLDPAADCQLLGPNAAG